MVQPIDISGVIYVLPIISFLLVSFIVFAALKKLEMFKSDLPVALIALFVATLFVTVAGGINLIQDIGAWSAILIVSAVFLLGIVGLFGKDMSKWNKSIGSGIIVIAIIIFVVSGLVVYSSYISPYLPGGQAVGSYSAGGFLTYFFYSPRVLGGVVLLVVSALAAWILTRKTK